MSVLVVGGGFAGWAAVSRVLEAQVRCTWLHAGVGASVAASGAADWDPAQPGHQQVSEQVRSFLCEQAGYQAPHEGVLVATVAGQVRRSHGCERAQLDLQPHAGQRISVLSAPLFGWDAAWLARSLNETPWAVNTGTSFAPLDIDWGQVDGRLTALVDLDPLEFAELLAPRIEALTQVVQGALGEQGAKQPVLTGPWCLADSDAALPWRARWGETLSDAWGLSGARFERRRQAWASARSELLSCHAARVERVRVDARSVTAWTDHREWTASCVVLATGGLVGGGLVLNDQRELVSVPVVEPSIPLQRRGELWLQPASQTGLDVQATIESELTSIGLPASSCAGKLTVAGELRADLPRGVLAAVSSGIEAAERALGAL